MTDHPRPPRILCIDDEQSTFDLLRLVFTRKIKDVEVDFAWGPGEALPKLDSRAYDLVITDLYMPDPGAGYDLLRRIREAGHEMPVVLYTAKDSHIDRVLATAIGGFDAAFSKVHYRELVAYVVDLLEQPRPTRGAAADGADQDEGHERPAHPDQRSVPTGSKSSA